MGNIYVERLEKEIKELKANLKCNINQVGTLNSTIKKRENTLKKLKIAVGDFSNIPLIRKVANKDYDDDVQITKNVLIKYNY